MRLSIDQRDPGYMMYGKLAGEGHKIRVLLNGAEVKHCTLADEELGVVVVRTHTRRIERARTHV